MPAEVIPIMYRMAAGAPKERNVELLALVDASIVSFGPGPSPEVSFDPAQARFVVRSTRLSKPAEAYFDVLVQARIDCTVYPAEQQSTLIRNMLHRGTIRPYMNGAYHPGGIDVDGSQNVIDASGRAQRKLWALGILAEGPNYCTYVLPRAQVNSRFLQFSGRCVLQMFASIDADNARRRPSAAVAVPASPRPAAEDGLPANRPAEPGRPAWTRDGRPGPHRNGWNAGAMSTRPEPAEEARARRTAAHDAAGVRS